MTYYGGKELAEAFRTVRANTIRITATVPITRASISTASTAPNLGPGGRFTGAMHAMNGV